MPELFMNFENHHAERSFPAASSYNKACVPSWLRDANYSAFSTGNFLNPLSGSALTGDRPLQTLSHPVNRIMQTKIMITKKEISSCTETLRELFWAFSSLTQIANIP